MSVKMPPLPYKSQPLDGNGLFTDIWAKWFQYAFLRMGGNIALSNVELATEQEASISTLTMEVAALETEVASLQTQVDGLGGIGLTNGRQL